MRFPAALYRGCLLFLVLPVAVFGIDQVVMKNGDRYSGRIESIEGGKLRFTAEYAGSLNLPWDAVSDIVSGDTFVLRTQLGGIESATAERLLALREQIIWVRNSVEQDRVLRTMELANAPVWAGFGDVGLSLARGNADTSTLSSALSATRSTPRNKIGLTASSLYSRAVRDGERLTSANLRRGGFRWDRNFGPRAFSFVSGDLEHNPIQNLRLRSVIGVGLGRHLIRNQRHTFDLFGGGTYNREDFTTADLRTSGEGLFSEASTHKIGNTFQLTQRFIFFPNFTQRGEYRMTFDGSAITAIRRWLSWQVTVGNRYISNPPLGALPNDLLLTTGFRVTFGPKQ
ncbi:hypothetical protein F183_A04840 [Bryobacterales bacterium F-183]|nr:hypothetical protein F183_A04840 [Bryobacterales bacterium F-183]